MQWRGRFLSLPWIPASAVTNISPRLGWSCLTNTTHVLMESTAPDVRGHGQPGSDENDVYQKYAVQEILGEGMYGTVYKAVALSTGELVALKKMRIDVEDEGIPATAVREISLLKEAKHPNVIDLLDVYVTPTRSMLYLVFELSDMDLRVFMKKNGAFEGLELKEASFQVVKGVAFCHNHRILHRDLKPQNLLIDIATGRIKLADFGLARTYAVPLKTYTHDVVTLWYRAPEILLGIRTYGTPVDVWSLGCIIAELATCEALFPGDSEVDTIFKIFQRVGTPNEEVWPGVTTLSHFKRTFPKWQGNNLADLQESAPSLGAPGVQLLQNTLLCDPVGRSSAQRMLSHEWFQDVHPALKAFP